MPSFSASNQRFFEVPAWLLVNTLECLSQALERAGHGDKPMDLFCHSLGSRVVIRALAMAAKRHAGLDGATTMPLSFLPRLGRIVILGGSEVVLEAQLMQDRLAACFGGLADAPSFYNIVSRENDVLDFMAENFTPTGFGHTSQVIGHNGLGMKPEAEVRVERPRGRVPELRARLPEPIENWMDLQIDGRVLQDWMKTHHSLSVAGDRPNEGLFGWNVWDHWYYYTYRPNMEFYQRILRNRETWSLARLRSGMQPIPEGVYRSGRD